MHSINASGHKYGLVYPGVGWAIWRDAAALPRELVFDVNYLGGSMPTFALNLSRPGSEVLAQYFMFLALGKQGYGEIQRSSNRIAHHIATQIAAIGPYRLITDGSELPVVAFTLRSRGDTQPAPPCSTSQPGCANSAGWYRPTRSPSTAKTCPSSASWSAQA